jgi:hypothetical protein
VTELNCISSVESAREKCEFEAEGRGVLKVGPLWTLSTSGGALKLQVGFVTDEITSQRSLAEGDSLGDAVVGPAPSDFEGVAGEARKYVWEIEKNPQGLFNDKKYHPNEGWSLCLETSESYGHPANRQLLALGVPMAKEVSEDAGFVPCGSLEKEACEEREMLGECEWNFFPTEECARCVQSVGRTQMHPHVPSIPLVASRAQLWMLHHARSVDVASRAQLWMLHHAHSVDVASRAQLWMFFTGI